MNASSNAYETSLPDEEDEEIEDFYRAPLGTPQTGGSIGSFADFISAPGRAPRSKGSGNLGRSLLTKVNGHSSSNGSAGDLEMEDELLFDEDELAARAHSKLGTEESTSVSSQDEDRAALIPEGKWGRSST